MSAASLLLRWQVWIPPEPYSFFACECSVLSSGALCVGLITRPKEFYRLWCVVACHLQTSRMRKPRPALGRSAIRKKNYYVKNLWRLWRYNPSKRPERHVQRRSVTTQKTGILDHTSVKTSNLAGNTVGLTVKLFPQTYIIWASRRYPFSLSLSLSLSLSPRADSGPHVTTITERVKANI